MNDLLIQSQQDTQPEYKRRLVRAKIMANESSSLSSDLMSPDADDEKSQVVGRQIWRIVPYAKRYPKRVVAGITSNAI